MKKIIISIACVFVIPFLLAQSIGSPPVVSAVNMVQIGGKVYVDYNLHIETNPVACYVTLVISRDEESGFNIYALPEYLEGDVGDNVTTGTGKQIIWDIYRQAQEYGSQGIDGEEAYAARVIARRNDEWAYVQGTAGVTFSPGGPGFFTPGGSYNVSLYNFYIARHEITQAEYLAVMGTNPSFFTGNLQRPVERVSWFNAIEYCNRRSIQEGLTPAYTYSSYGTNPDDWPPGWNTTGGNHSNLS